MMNSAEIDAKLANIRNKYELPPTVTIKIHTKGLDRDMRDAVLCLLAEERDELPFQLARYMSWPSSKRAITARAQVFLRNGYLDFIEKSLAISKTDVTAEEKSGSAPGELVSQTVDGFPASPRVQI